MREFLASEAMAALGVPTTRALCVVSTGDKVRRQRTLSCHRGGQPLAWFLLDVDSLGAQCVLGSGFGPRVLARQT